MIRNLLCNRIALFFIFFFQAMQCLLAQSGSISGKLLDVKGYPLSHASISAGKHGGITDTAGLFNFQSVAPGKYHIKISLVGYIPFTKQVIVRPNEPVLLRATLMADTNNLGDVVITGTMKSVSRAASPIPVEVFTPKFFQKNPTPNLFEAVGMINGVRPQLNCNVCNTGDIHINGMEGPYTLVLIDGMPIVSALSTVYGLSGIPNSMVERIEVVKGPAASLYGSEAMGGIINVITKNPVKAPLFSVDVFGTSWQEYSLDAAAKFKFGKAQSLLGLNYFNYQHPLDSNGDGFTDVTLQSRVSIFNKWVFTRKQNRLASIGLRYVNEDRYGGQMSWTKKWRGSDSIYGESVYTKRFELIGVYQLPVKEKILLQYSYNWHDQNSFYGKIPYNATQRVAFAQLYWDKSIGKKNEFLLGISYRSTFYDDNTPATAAADLINPKNQPATTPLPGIFLQDEWRISDKHVLLAGYRYDYDKIHGNIHSPRVAYKWSAGKNNTIRASFGTGFRVVNLFTEDHAALTGARQVVIKEALKPEQSLNSTVNYVTRLTGRDFFIGIDATAFYSYFSNRITGDFDTDPNKIIYDNLKGHAVSRGISVNADLNFVFPLKIMAGVSYTDVYQKEKNIKSVQLFAPKWSGNYSIGYTFPKKITIDFTGSFTGPMRLPLQRNDYRPAYSPWFTIANIQLTKKFSKGLEVYAGMKNIFNFIPRHSLMRPFDPFDRTAADPVTNPNGYTFDTEYNFAPIQGIRGFLGIRYNLL